jgi:hypothetical protein
MVYIHFPSNHTEEEITLQAKYQKLKRKVSLDCKELKSPCFGDKISVNKSVHHRRFLTLALLG